ncbi:uncharacterized protein LOC132795677 [Drosophila nasuta]|uniref:Uncharacterized protein LOC117577090 n=1 Tax=Drosophila albomicans TaxID=7291 RepID=A0A6P8ZFF9_DROAB|nr:uncharacterized protein LOC117577090 [Drosophila albomicans]XP_060662518.1 uncharacterized protein LOC132795677 [Drosophila nasuta]
MSVSKKGFQRSSNNYASRSSNESRISKGTPETVSGRQQEENSMINQKSSSSIISKFAHLRPRGGLRGKAYWRDVIDEVEFAVHCVSQPRLPVIDYSLVLPPRLRERVKQIQSYDFSSSDDVVFIRDEMREERPHDYQIASEQDSREDGQDGAPLVTDHGRKKLEEQFNESQHSDIVRMDHEFEKFDLRLDEPVGHTHRTLDKTSWYAKFLCATRDERVSWDSKVERSKPGSAVYTLDEQAENLMDASAERFIHWLNSIGTMDTSMTPEKVKNLFSIKGDRTLLASVKTDPKEVNAIAQTVADKWNKPHMAIELKYEKHINDHAMRISEKPLLSAFGRTVPLKERPWVKRSGDKVIETVYPNDLLTREKIFKGITHLRSTTALIDFYLNNPKLARPLYLLQGGDFQEMSTSESVVEVPLYEYLGLRY